jgi:hypothetical protein
MNQPCLVCGSPVKEGDGYCERECVRDSCGFKWTTYDDGSVRYWYKFPLGLKNGLWKSEERECPFGCLLVVASEEL